MPDAFVYCSRCGTPNNAAAAYCLKCGSPMAPAPSSTPTLVSVAPLAQAAAAPVVAYAPTAGIRPRYGGFWIRFLAFLLDSVILSVVWVPLFLIFLLPSLVKTISQVNRDEPPPAEFFAAIFLMIPLFFAIAWLYEAWTTSSSWQGTVGKKVLRLKVTDEAGNRISFGRSTGRFFAKLLSRAIMHIGFIMIGFTERKRGLHDMLAGTLVVRY